MVREHTVLSGHMFEAGATMHLWKGVSQLHELPNVDCLEGSKPGLVYSSASEAGAWLKHTGISELSRLRIPSVDARPVVL